MMGILLFTSATPKFSNGVWVQGMTLVYRSNRVTNRKIEIASSVALQRMALRASIGKY